MEKELDKVQLSFIDEKVELKTINNIGELRNIVEECRKNKQKLCNFDFSILKDIRNICFDGLILENIVFSRFNPKSPNKTFLFNLSFMGAQLHKISFAQAHLQQCNFDTMDEEAIHLHLEKMDYQSIIKKGDKTANTHLQEVDFFFSQLDYCRFRRSELNTVDFRYSHINDCTMGEINVYLGDFYFCAFEGCTGFIDGVFKECSFTCATFENNCIRMKNIPEGIIQEHFKIYHDKLIHAKNWINYNPCGTFSSMNHEANNKMMTLKSYANATLEAANFYKGLSGIFAGKGLNRDSNEAYRMSKILDSKFCKIELNLSKEDRVKGEKNFSRRIFLNKVYWSLGYGYKWQAPTIWFFLIIAAYALISLIIDSTMELGNSFSWSLYNSLSPYEKFTNMFENRHIVTLVSFESLFGVLIIGFLGFIIANNIRNDS